MQDARCKMQDARCKIRDASERTTQRLNDTTNQRVMRCTTLTADEPAGFLVLCSFASPFTTTGSIESRSLARSLVRSLGRSARHCGVCLVRGANRCLLRERACLPMLLVDRSAGVFPRLPWHPLSMSICASTSCCYRCAAIGRALSVLWRL
jgi:hypothetical protein